MSDAEIDIEKAWFSGFDYELCQVTRNVNAVLSSASNLTAIYIMVRHSPSHMKTYRWFLMNTVVWSWLWDFFATELFAPHPTLPAQGVCVLGFLRVAGFYGTIVCFVLMIHLVGGCVMSVLCAAAFRLAAVYNVQDIFAKKRGFICVAVLHNCMCTPVYVAAAFVVPVVVANQPEYVRQASNFTGVANVIKDHACTFASFDDPAWQVSIVVTTVSIVIAVLVASGIFVACGVALWSRRKQMSAKTYKMHRNLIVSLSVQFIVPGITLVIPAFVLVLTIALEASSTLIRIWPFIAQLMASHSILNSVLMVLCTAPYLAAVRKMMPKWKKRINPEDAERSRTVSTKGLSIVR